jgi:hypothetical protein
MSAHRFTDFALAFGFLQTKKNKVIRQSMFDYIKSFIGSIEIAQKIKVFDKKTKVFIEQDDFVVWFDSKEFFNLGCTFDKDSAIAPANALINEICKKLNEKDWKEKSKVNVLSSYRSMIDSKHDFFSPFIRKDTWINLFGENKTYKPRRIEIWQPPDEDDMRRGVNIISRKKGNMIECILSNVYTGNLPMDVVSNFISDLQKTQETILVKLTSEK